MVIKTIRMPWAFKSFLKLTKDEVVTNFPKVGNENFMGGKNLLY